MVIVEDNKPKSIARVMDGFGFATKVQDLGGIRAWGVAPPDRLKTHLTAAAVGWVVRLFSSACCVHGPRTKT